jgi:hypothetical protein
VDLYAAPLQQRGPTIVPSCASFAPPSFLFEFLQWTHDMPDMGIFVLYAAKLTDGALEGRL